MYLSTCRCFAKRSRHSLSVCVYKSSSESDRQKNRRAARAPPRPAAASRACATPRSQASCELCTSGLPSVRIRKKNVCRFTTGWWMWILSLVWFIQKIFLPLPPVSLSCIKIAMSKSRHGRFGASPITVNDTLNSWPTENVALPFST